MLHHHESELSFVGYVIGASVILASIIISATLLYTFKGPSSLGTAAAPDTQTGGKVAIKLAPNTPFLGNDKAKVTVIEYADYRCPFCERFYQTVMPDLLTKYIQTGKIKFVYQDVAFLGPDSNSAGEAAYCATEQGKFWQFHDYLFDHQGDESGDWASAANQKKYAATVGLDMAAFNTCFDSGKYKQQVVADTATAQTYGVTGTPTTFINGTPIVGAQPAATFEAAIDALLK